MARGADTRLKIQTTALELFVAHGVSETSVRDLAQAAGIAEGTLYRHYVSKDELVTDLFLSNTRTFTQRLRENVPAKLPLQQRLQRVVHEVFTFHDEHPTLFRFLLLSQHQSLPHMEDGEDNPVSWLQDCFEQALARKEVPPRPAPFLTAMILGLLLQPATSVVYQRLSAPLSSYTDEIAQACWLVVSAPLSPTQTAKSVSE